MHRRRRKRASGRVPIGRARWCTEWLREVARSRMSLGRLGEGQVVSDRRRAQGVRPRQSQRLRLCLGRHPDWSKWQRAKLAVTLDVKSSPNGGRERGSKAGERWGRKGTTCQWQVASAPRRRQREVNKGLTRRRVPARYCSRLSKDPWPPCEPQRPYPSQELAQHSRPRQPCCPQPSPQPRS